MDKTGARYTEERIHALWLLFLAAPSRPGPDETNRYDLGNIGSTPEKNWTKMTPYTLAKLKNPHALESSKR